MRWHAETNITAVVMAQNDVVVFIDVLSQRCPINSCLVPPNDEREVSAGSRKIVESFTEPLRRMTSAQFPPILPGCEPRDLAFPKPAEPHPSLVVTTGGSPRRL